MHYPLGHYRAEHPKKEPRVFDFVGMMDLALMPCHQFPSDTPAGFLSVHAMKDADLATKLSAFIAAGKPTGPVIPATRQPTGRCRSQSGRPGIGSPIPLRRPFPPRSPAKPSDRSDLTSFLTPGIPRPSVGV